MVGLSQTSLLVDEQALVERFIQRLEIHFQQRLHAVWLFGSRARGERPDPESDVDLLVLVDDASWDGRMLVRKLLDEAAQDLDLQALVWYFSIHVHTPQWLAERRKIQSFFMAELDRDKVPLRGLEAA